MTIAPRWNILAVTKTTRNEEDATVYGKLKEPSGCRVDVAGGKLVGASGAYEKRFGDLRGLYEDAEAFEKLLIRADDVVYDVTDFRPSQAAGDVIFGVTRMSPGKVGREYFFTRGHVHANADRPEIYYGEAGHGVMLLESPEGETRTIEIAPRVICYVPPYWIHRSVNVGPDELVMTFAYPADSGQDYEIIARSDGMRSRIVDDGGGGWRLVDNGAYRPRDARAIAAVYASARR